MENNSNLSYYYEQIRFAFDEKVKNNYELKILQIKEIAQKKIFMISGLNKKNKDDYFILKLIPIKTLNEEEILQILKELNFTFGLKNYNYFQKNITSYFSSDEEYLFLKIKENVVSLSILISSKKTDYLDSNNLKKWIIYQVTFALFTLHSNKIIHHDIKPSNILINQKAEISVTDFGSAIFMGDNSFIYTLPYAAPEFLIDDLKNDEKIDMWGLGVIIIELFCRINQIFKTEGIITKESQLKYLFEKLGVDNKYKKENKEKLIDSKNIKFKIPKEISKKINDKEALNLVENLIVFNPEERYSAKQVLESPYLRDFQGNDRLESSIEFPINYKEEITKGIKDKKTYIELIKKIIN